MFLANIPAYPTEAGSFAFSGQTLGEVVDAVLPYVFGLAGLGLFVYFLIGGFTLMTAAGNPKNVQKGQQMLTHAIIGFLIIISAYWIAQIMGVITGISLLG